MVETPVLHPFSKRRSCPLVSASACPWPSLFRAVSRLPVSQPDQENATRHRLMTKLDWSIDVGVVLDASDVASVQSAKICLIWWPSQRVPRRGDTRTID